MLADDPVPGKKQLRLERKVSAGAKSLQSAELRCSALGAEIGTPGGGVVTGN